MAVKVREKVTADGKKFQKMLEDLDKLEVRIGIQQGAGSDNGVDLVDIAMFNELGTVHIPSRPFLRDSVDAHSSEINAFLQSMRTQLVKGGSAEDVLKKIGVFQKGLIQKEERTPAAGEVRRTRKCQKRRNTPWKHRPFITPISAAPSAPA